MARKQNAAAVARDLRHRVLTSMSKLSDKDTHLQAVSELESIIPTLALDTFSLFINSLLSTSTADRAAVRSASLKLLSSLSSHHGIALSPHLPKLTSAVLRRLRDSDTSVRSAAVSAVSVFSQYSISSSSAFNSLIRSLVDSLVTEQEATAQSASAMCIAAAIDASPDVDTVQVMKFLPKWMKLLKSDGYKAKAAVLVLVRSVVRVCEIGNCNLLRELVNCIVEFLKSEDWMARKAAAEALTEIAVADREFLSEMKSNCLKMFESRKFDKIKGVREAMIQMVEVWKEVPDVFDDGLPPPHSQTSSNGNASDGRLPVKYEISSAVGSSASQSNRKQAPSRRSSVSDSSLKNTARKRGGSGKQSSSPVSWKLDCKRPSDRDVESTDLHGSSATPGTDDSVIRRVNVRSSKPETKRGLFSKNPFSRVVPYVEGGSEAAVVVSNACADICRHHQDSKDLSLIRKQLVQIESQQSNLMDVLQKFIGSSQDGMRTLETRVHGLERALDDISYDLAISTARVSNVESPRTSCCMLPGPDFLSSKFWRRPGYHSSTSQFSFPASTPPVSAMRSLADKSPSNAVGLENRRFRLRGPGGVIMNPLAQHGNARGFQEPLSSRVPRSVRTAA